MRRRIAVFLMLAGLASVTLGIFGSFTTAVSAWDCSKPENFGVAECPIPPTTTTTLEETTTTTVPCTEGRGCCLQECEGPTTTTTKAPEETTTTTAPEETTTTAPAETTTTEAVPPVPPGPGPATPSGQPELAFTGATSNTWKIAVVGGILLMIGAFLVGYGYMPKRWSKITK